MLPISTISLKSGDCRFCNKIVVREDETAVLQRSHGGPSDPLIKSSFRSGEIFLEMAVAVEHSTTYCMIAVLRIAEKGDERTIGQCGRGNGVFVSGSIVIHLQLTGARC
ncbi:hypothetical protein C4E04_08235 [Microvirga sp. 17 mud 1-3]|nr:hypothetical protein C4E04_08235 [Microvirga sp. 17 mud 1-3]